MDDFRRQLKKRNLPKHGNKPQLHKRLQNHLIQAKQDPTTFLFEVGSILKSPFGRTFATEAEFEVFMAEPDVEQHPDFESDVDDCVWDFIYPEAEARVVSMAGKTDFDNIQEIAKDPKSCYEYLKDLGVLKREPPICQTPRCNRQRMKLIPEKNLDGLLFRCGKTVQGCLYGHSC